MRKIGQLFFLGYFFKKKFKEMTISTEIVHNITLRGKINTESL
jgi:hypothetical protein